MTPLGTALQEEVWKALNPMKCFAITPGAIAELINRHPTAVTSALRSMYMRGIVNKTRRSVLAGRDRCIDGKYCRTHEKRTHFWRIVVLKCGQ